jgi:O-antigen ligase
MRTSTKEFSVYLENTRFVLLCLIFFTIAFSLLNLNSVFIVLLAATWLFQKNFAERIKNLAANRLFFAYLVYVLVETAGLIYAPDARAGWKQFESKIGLLVVPIFFCSGNFISVSTRTKSMLVFAAALAAAAAYCLILASITYVKTGELESFFYHQLLSPLKHHAVYFSIYIFVCIVFLLSDFIQNRSDSTRRRVYFLITYFVVVLILLSSKLVLVVVAGYFIYLSIVYLLSRKNKKAVPIIGAFVVLLIFLALLIDTPVKRRFSDISRGNLELITQKKFDGNVYFNGLEFRLLLWRITYDIIEENDAFLFGIGPGNGKKYLSEKYRQLGMYAGDGTAQNPGYIQYNCHNQFLQAGLQSGILGVMAVLFWLICAVRAAILKKYHPLSVTLLLIGLFFMVESVFERQYGIFLCTFLICIFTEVGNKQRLREDK